MFYLDGDRLSFKNNGRPLYRRLLSEEHLSKRFGRLFTADSCLYLLFSPGLGYGLSWLLRNPLPASSLLIIFEGDESLFPFYHAQTSELAMAVQPAKPARQSNQLGNAIRTQYEYWKKLRQKLETLPNVMFCPQQDTDAQLHWLIEQLFYSHRPLRRTRGLRFCGQAQSINYTLLEKRAFQLIQQKWQNHSTTLFMSPLWIKNAFANCLHNLGTMELTSLPALLGNRPIILCGAGISLEAVLAEIRHRQADGYAIAAVDTALPTLIESGIVPQIVVMLESQFANMDDFIASSVLRYLKDSLFIHDILAHSPTVRCFPHRMAFVSRFAASNFFSLLPKNIPVVPPLGSVGPTALYILLHYSNSSIFFCGFDFAFPRGRTHSKSAPAHQHVLRTATRLLPPTHWALEVPRHIRLSIEGASYLSDSLMKSYADRFAEIIKLKGKNMAMPLSHHQPAETSAQILTEEKGTWPQVQVWPASTPAGNYRQTIYRHLRNMLQLQERLGNLLRLLAPGRLLSSEAETQGWQEILDDLETYDFLWRFLPGERIPEYTEAFLSPLARNMNYWINYLQRLLAERIAH